MKYYFVYLFLGYLALADGYVLLQMRKDENNSNVDAVIHKKVAGAKYDNLAKRMSRKQLGMQSESGESAETVESPKANANPLVLGINTGAKVEGKRSQTIDDLLRAVRDTFQGEEPLFRSKSFEFSDGSSPRSKSMGIEVDTQTLLESVGRFISSRKFKRAAENIAKKAAIIFRALREDV